MFYGKKVMARVETVFADLTIFLSAYAAVFSRKCGRFQSAHADDLHMRFAFCICVFSIYGGCGRFLQSAYMRIICGINQHMRMF